MNDIEQLRQDARRWNAVKRRHGMALVELATGNRSYASHQADAILDGWADRAAHDIEAFDPQAYRQDVEARLQALERQDDQ